MTLEQALKNLGLDDLQKVAEPAVFEIISVFEAAPTKSNLARTIAELYPPEELLGIKSKRNLLIENLTELQIKGLAEALDLDSQEGTLWEACMKRNFTATSERKTLYGYFQCRIPEPEQSQPDLDSRPKELVHPAYSLFEHQNVAASESIKLLLESGKALLHMPTGAGKTRTAMHIATRLMIDAENGEDDQVVVWLADSEELCRQAAEEFAKSWSFMGNRPVQLYKLYGTHDVDLCDIRGGFLVAGLQKLNSRFSADQIGKLALSQRCSLIIFDEAHRILAPTYQYAVEMFQAAGSAKLLGLTATPGRATMDDEANREFAQFFNKNKVTLHIHGYKSPIHYLQDEGYLAQVAYYQLEGLGAEDPSIQLTQSEIDSINNGNEVSARLLDILGKDSRRNIKIVSCVQNLVSQGRKTILFACSVSHAVALTAILKYKNIQAEVVTSITTDAVSRSRIISDYRSGKMDVLVNYGVLTTGFDAPITSAAVITRPTTSLSLFSQMIGRATRGERVGGNSTAEVYTVIDDAIPGFRDMASAFEHWDDAFE